MPPSRAVTSFAPGATSGNMAAAGASGHARRMSSPTAALDDYDAEMRNVLQIVPPSQQREVKRVMMNKAILSSTTLQMFLYYNLFYSLTFFWFWVLAFRWKYLNHEGLRVQYFSPIFFTIWCFSEVARIYVGYQGNLKEDTPNMAAFLFLTIFPQMLITIYFVSMQVPLYGFDRIFSGIMLAFLCVEFLLAWRCLGQFIADKTARFSVEYGGIEESDEASDNANEVVAYNRYIEEDPSASAQAYEEEEEEFQGINDLVESRPPTMRSTRAAPNPEDMIFAPSRSGVFSFGGTGAQPLRPLSQSVPRRSAPRGAGAPTPSAAAPLTSPVLSASLRSPLKPYTARENETPEERLARRARDRAIISGTIVPDRRRDLAAANVDTAQEELLAEQRRIALEQTQAIERLSTTRQPFLAPSPHTVRIPTRAELAARAPQQSPPPADPKSE